ncbi:serine hydrolase [Alicyclobacillus fastidiosus]|uniref:Beta-lactamase class A catalytic domain-containing protein n=1 Tax=Alicyclobacillus fastidiosus TaxID=392011 RepID=A0ABV5AJG0_9BACL|nr:serine hydrolase [Alicyclobacillus fastidiosus]WEH08339.1 hypothetical protein PYS47_16780 [Alicyclobacillus fastidiosus]
MAKRKGSIVSVAVIGTVVVLFLWHSQASGKSNENTLDRVNKQAIHKVTKAIHTVKKHVIHSATQANLNPFGTQFLQLVKGRSDTISVAIYNEKTEQTYTYHPDAVYCPASTIKVPIMAETLEKTDGNLSEEQQEQLTTMIENSDDDAATDLWEENGGTPAMQTFMSELGMADTVANNAWGLSTTTASDMLKTMKLFAYPNKILTDSERNYGLGLMENVEADQRWGGKCGSCL